VGSLVEVLEEGLAARTAEQMVRGLVGGLVEGLVDGLLGESLKALRGTLDLCHGFSPVVARGKADFRFRAESSG
jgi:hypothetical protein